MRCIGAFVDGTDLVLFTHEINQQVPGLPQARKVHDLGSIVSWAVGTHTTDYTSPDSRAVYQLVSIHMIGGNVFEYHVKVGRWGNTLTNISEIEYDTGLIEELISILQRRFT